MLYKNGFLKGRKFNAKIVIILIIAVIIISIFIQEVIVNRLIFGIGKQSEKNRIVKAEDLKIQLAEERSIIDNREYFGEITFIEKVSVSSKVTGKLEKIYVKEGQIIQPGTVIAQIERLPLQLTLKQQQSELDIAKTSYSLAQSKYDNALKSIEIKFMTIEKAKADLFDKEVTFQNIDRLLNNKKVLYKAGGVSETELKSVEAQHTSAHTKVKLAKADLDIQEVGFRDSDITSVGIAVPADKKAKIEILKKLNTKMELAELDAAQAKIRQVEANIESTNILLKETTITSPFWGTVASKNMDAGELVKSDSVIANLININNILLVININERDIESIKLGQKVTFIVDALKDKKFDGAITSITPVLDAKTRTMAIKVLVNNKTKLLLPGMFARATIITGKNIKRIILPVSAIIDKRDNKGMVYIIKRDIVFKQDVELGIEHKEGIEIFKGVENSDEVVTSGINTIYPGLKIQR